MQDNMCMHYSGKVENINPLIRKCIIFSKQKETNAFAEKSLKHKNEKVVKFCTNNFPSPRDNGKKQH